MDKVVKHFPTAEELTSVKTNLKCPEDGCNGYFLTESNLTLHLVKSHKKTHLWQTGVLKQFYCPEAECAYHSLKHFKSMKLLKQHYVKVHVEKSFKCPYCNKTFSSTSLLGYHVDYCGVMFNCGVCQASYDSYESLKTHGRRKNHAISEKFYFKPIRIFFDSNSIVISKKAPIILPKPKQDFVERASIAVQTDSSSQFQKAKKTQTTENFSRKPEKQNKKSIKTQTNPTSSKSSSCNTSFNLNDFKFTILEDTVSTSSATQSDFDYSSFSLDYPAFGVEPNNDVLVSALGDSPFDEIFNCNMETQTDLNFEEDLFEMATNHTQTCDRMFEELGLNDMETQTGFEEMLRSVESQTMMSHLNKEEVSMTIETQTDQLC